MKDKYNKIFCCGQTIVYVDHKDQLCTGVIVNLDTRHNYTTSTCIRIDVKNYETDEVDKIVTFGRERLTKVVILPMICTKESLGIV